MNQLCVVICISVAATVYASSVKQSDTSAKWEIFKKEFGKSYELAEESQKLAAFAKNLKFIKEHNDEAAAKSTPFRLGINKYSDMDITEVRDRMNGYKRPSSASTNASLYLSPSNLGSLPDHVDWREKGYVTPVKDQGQCGSCWAFSTTGSLEGQHFRASGKLTSLSEQQLVDCVPEPNEGCNGGWMDQAFWYIEVNHGIDTEGGYPYDARKETCHFMKSDTGATDSGYVNIPPGDEQALKEAVATIGPVSIAIDATQASFFSYKSGVYVEPKCKLTVDHAVLIVGYGTDVGTGLDYWLVKNSWGTSWGEQGYIRMARNHNNQCSIASYASYPLV